MITSLPATHDLRWMLCCKERNIRVMYRYLNKDKPLTGELLCAHDSGRVTVKLDNGDIMVNSWKSWEIQK